MYRKEVNQKSPLRILDRSTKRGLGPGNLGVVMARAGVGKTAFLIQIGLDEAMRERNVLHIALGQTLEHVHSWYDALFDDLAELNALDNREQVRALINTHRLIQAYPDSQLPHERLDEVVALYQDRLKFSPSAILIDDFDWQGGEIVRHAAELGALKIIAKRLQAELWITAQTYRADTSQHPTHLMSPCDTYSELIELAVFLEPEGRDVSVRLLKDHANPQPAETHLTLHSDSMSLASDDGVDRQVTLPAQAFTLLSGGAKGSEATFGASAERWGLNEVHFSFAGRETERKRGVVELSEEELERGGVSDSYIQAQLHRSFPKTEKFQRLLKTIWHQVATAGEVFVIGEILENQTVKGGTGWGAELGRHFDKAVYVFDQSKGHWFQWNDGSWTKIEAPSIRRRRFTGTGTRLLNDVGREAIEELFERSFGPAED